MPPQELDGIVLRCAPAQIVRRICARAVHPDRQVEVVVVRDPDGPVDTHVFIDGVKTPVTEFTIDAGAGWCWADWKRCRDRNLSAASPSARQTMLAAYADPPGGRYVGGRGEAQWLDEVSTASTTDEGQR
jgi:hypothetical protein